MNRYLGVLLLVAGVIAYVVWQRPAEPPKPETLPKQIVVQYANGVQMWRGIGDPGPRVEGQVYAELQRSVPLDELQRTGATVVTTIDLKAQTAGASVLIEVGPGQPENLRYLLVAVESATGDVRAYVTGSTGTQPDFPVANDMLRGSGFVSKVTGADGAQLFQAQGRSAFGSNLRVGEACGAAMCGAERGTAWTIGATPRYEVLVFVNDERGPSHAIWEKFAALLL